MSVKNKLITLKSHFDAAKLNVNGAKCKQRLVIIESDDWGAIRTPSKEILNYFEKNNIDVSKSIYKNDALESQSDLEMLFERLAPPQGLGRCAPQRTRWYF